MFFNYIIISYCTNNSKYINYGKNLAKQLSDYNLNYNIQFLDFHYDTKLKNCLYKSQFILDKLLEYKRLIIWMDIDSIITKQPINYINNLINQSFDIGVVYTPERKHPITDAIHIYNYTDKSILFLNYWNNLNKDSNLKSLDHKRLDQTFNYFKDKMSIIDIRYNINNWFKAVFSQDNTILNY